jgi:nitroreductase
MELFEALKARRTERAFLPDEVADDAVERLLWAAGRAPQAGNMPVRRFVIVSDAAILRSLAQVTPSFLAREAPLIIVICTDLEAALALGGKQNREILSLIDSGAAAENIALAALELGLGTYFFRSSNEAALRVVLRLPPLVRPDILVAIGKPRRTDARRARALPPVVFRDRFDEPWEANHAGRSRPGGS